MEAPENEEEQHGDHHNGRTETSSLCCGKDFLALTS